MRLSFTRHTVRSPRVASREIGLPSSVTDAGTHAFPPAVPLALLYGVSTKDGEVGRAERLVLMATRVFNSTNTSLVLRVPSFGTQ